MSKGLYLKCSKYNSFTQEKYNIFLRSKKYLSNPRTLFWGFERYFSTWENTSYLVRVKELYKEHFEYNLLGLEAWVEL